MTVTRQAAVQAAVLSGTRDANLNDVLLIDVAPLTLGIEDAAGLMSALVPRGTCVCGAREGHRRL